MMTISSIQMPSSDSSLARFVPPVRNHSQLLVSKDLTTSSPRLTGATAVRLQNVFAVRCITGQALVENHKLVSAEKHMTNFPSP